MIKLILLGLLSAAFFSATFILNRSMSLSGGHWVWSSSLRFFYMFFLLVILISLHKGTDYLRGVINIFIRNFKFWLIGGSIGFGTFYSLLCYAADHAPGWVVAGTWQFTVIATPIVLLFFKEKVPRYGVFFSFFIFLGILLIQFYNKESELAIKHILYGVIPVVIAAFAYPTGNQLLNFAKHGNHSWIPHIDSPILKDAPTCVLLMTMGSIPFWFLLLVFVSPPPPLKGQLINTGIVAVSSGIIATSIFYKARNASKSPYIISAVDATQSGEVIFSLAGEILLLNGALPNLPGGIGIIIIVVGIVGYSLRTA
ncbi:MAG: multidrug resistance efflux transporter family protein [Deltaproteobacteria bacterium]|jgi:drug/metabolite transporter (DMT)-like permease|nr:multidrug resistance efflux transporter family protein [Deltaproteobacteria bacterium]